MEAKLLLNPPPPANLGSIPSSQAQTAAASHNTNPFRPTISVVPAPAAGLRIHASQDSVSSQHSNPFRTPKHTPQSSESSTQFRFSPISPIEEDQDHSQAPPSTKPLVRVAKAQKMSSEPRKSADLRKLDGTPYPGREDEADSKPRKVKVAQDMYAGEMPPGYERKDYQGPLDTSGTRQVQHGGCHKCGGHKRDASDTSVASEKTVPAQNIDCHQCGGQQSMSPSSVPRASMANARAPSQASPRAVPVQSSEAGPSSTPGGHRHKCTKCGRRKRPESLSSSGQSPVRAGISIRPMPQIQTNGMPMVGIHIEPPTAITERAPTLPFSPASTVGETPLIKHEGGGFTKEHKPSRSGSISSLFRSLSRRKKSKEQNPLPSQQLASSGERSPSNIINKISHAIGDGETAEYSRLRPDDYIERPGSPFSFVDKPQEDQAFEMNDMRKSKQPERRNSWDKADENTQFLANPADRPRYSRSQSTRTSLKPADAQDDIYLSLPPDQRPGVTRFKSLRTGVNRAASGLSRSASQISRSTSLRRLESVKKVPSLWYRDDMAIEGAHSEYDNYVY